MGKHNDREVESSTIPLLRTINAFARIPYFKTHAIANKVCAQVHTRAKTLTKRFRMGRVSEMNRQRENEL